MGAVRAQHVVSGPEPLAAGQTSPLTARPFSEAEAKRWVEDTALYAIAWGLDRELLAALSSVASLR